MAKQKAVTTEFKKALARKQPELEQARTKKDPYGNVTLEDGKYIGRACNARADVDNKGNPYFSYNVVVTHGFDADGEIETDPSYVGQRPGAFHGLVESKSGKVSVADKIEYLCYDLQRLGYETDDLDGEMLEAIADEINKDKPFVIITVKNDDEYGAQMRLKGLYEGDELKGGEEAAEESSEASEEASGEEAGEEAGEEETVEIEVGTTVEHGEYGVCTITHISGDGTSLKLKDSKGKVHTAVDPDEVEVIEVEAAGDDSGSGNATTEAASGEDDWIPTKGAKVVLLKPRKGIATIVRVTKSKQTAKVERDSDGAVFDAVPFAQMQAVE